MQGNETVLAGKTIATRTDLVKDSAMSSSWMIYGANGYTGELIAREAVARRHRPVLAGRDRSAVEPLARALDCESRIFPLDLRMGQSLAGITAVVHCAGPFSATSDPMVRACLESGTHYLDITGEIEVFESIFMRDHDARSASVALIPGVGFDVVPTDCLAAMLSDALPSATALSLAFHAKGGRISRGTLRTMIEGLPHGGAIRTDGKIVPVPVAYDIREIPFGSGTKTAMTIPWGDVSTAFHTTGIPNIRVYTPVSMRTANRLRRRGPLLRVLRFAPLRHLVQSVVARRGGPDEAVRERARSYLWGEVRDGSGRSVSLTMETPDGYSFTAVSAVRAVEKVLNGSVDPGAWTPAVAFGSHFVEEIPGASVGAIASHGQC